MAGRTDTKLVAAMLCLVFAVGGAGVNFPLLQLLLQISSLALAATILVWRGKIEFSQHERIALAFLGGAMLLPLLQLIPLPPALWSQLSGRDLVDQLDAALGVNRWRPLSLDIEGTIRSFTALFPAAAIFLATLSLPHRDRVQLLWVVLALALLSALLGVVQFATDGDLMPYPSGHVGSSVGLFVNRNHHAAFLLVSIPIAAFFARKYASSTALRTPWVVAALSAILLLGISILATTSRMGLALLPVVMAASLIMLFYRQAGSKLAIASVAAIAALASFLVSAGFLDRQLARFTSIGDPRLGYWTDIKWALEHYGFGGTGFGTFVPVYQTAESLESVVPQITNHAHNDYLEILLEGGLLGACLLIAALAFLVFHIVRSIRSDPNGKHKSAQGAAILGLLVLLAASLVDYPLRMPALSALFAVLVAIVLPAQPSRRPTQPAKKVGRAHAVRSLGALVAIGSMAFLAIQAGFSKHFLISGQVARALNWAPWSTEVHERLATQALVRNDLEGALEHGQAAAALSPISAPAIRSVGLAKLAQGKSDEGSQLMQVAVVLGWRDSLTQLWTIEAATKSQEPEKALQRAQSLFRQEKLVAPALTQILAMPKSNGIAKQFAQQLAQKPEWRDTVFEASSSLPPSATGAWLEVIAALKETSAPASLEEGRPLLDALVAGGQLPTAREYWLLLQRSDGLVTNGDFEDANDRRGASYPRYWYVSSDKRSVVDVLSPPGESPNRVLAAQGAKGGTVVRQQVFWAPGTYRLSFRARLLSKDPVTLRWELRCKGSNHRESAETLVRAVSFWQIQAVLMAVPNQDCSIQQLALRLPNDIVSSEFWIDDIRVTPTPR